MRDYQPRPPIRGKLSVYLSPVMADQYGFTCSTEVQLDQFKLRHIHFCNAHRSVIGSVQLETHTLFQYT